MMWDRKQTCAYTEGVGRFGYQEILGNAGQFQKSIILMLVHLPICLHQIELYIDNGWILLYKVIAQ